MANITKIYNLKLTGQKDLVGDMQIVNKSFDEAKKRFSELKSQFKSGLNTPEMSAIKLQMEQTRLEMLKLKKEQIELTNEGKAYNNALKIQREEERKSNQQRKLSLTEYQKLSKEHIELKNHAKEVGVIFGEESKEFKQAAAEANKLDVQLKKIDASLGQFQRNVGNYPKNINIGGISQNTFNQLKSSGLGDILGNQVDSVKIKVRELDSEFLILRNRITQARSSGVTDLNTLEKEIIQNRIEADRMNQEISQSTTHLNGLGSVGTGVFGRLNTDLKQLILGYVGLHAAMSLISNAKQSMYELSDNTTNLEIELEKATGGADGLVDSLSELDTRTKLTGLTEIANVAAKAGVAEQNLLGVTEAVDKASVAFGKDFGSIEEGTETFAKLINVFYEDREITGERILKIANSVRTLANETVASVPYINDFNGRMAGLKQMFTNFELSDSIGLGAGFQELQQSAEVASTALVKVLPKLAADTEKYAKIVGKTKKEFSDLINNNPAEALIQVSEALVKGGQNVEQVSEAFADSELGSGRIATILATLGGKADLFRERIARAGETIQDTTAIEDAFNKKNENFAATIDKIGKKFADLGNNKGFQKLLISLSSLLLGLITTILNIPFGWWIAGITLLTLAYWSNIKAMTVQFVTNASLIAQEMILNGLIFYETVLINAQALATWALNGAKRALIVTMNLLGISTARLRIAWLWLNTTILSTPIGWILAGILAIGATYSATAGAIEIHTKKVNENTEAYRRNIIEQRVNTEVTKRANEATSDILAKMEILTRIINDNANSLRVRKKALEELIAINPKHLEGLTLENTKLAEGVKILNEYKNKILEVAKAKAAQQLLEEKQKKLLENENERAKISADFDIRYGEDVGKIKKVARVVEDVVLGFASKSGLGKGDLGTQIINIDSENKELREEIDTLLEKVVDANTKDVLENILNNTNKNDKGKYKGSKLSAQQKDFLKDIDAIRDKLLADNEKAYTKGEISEKDYLSNILSINTDAWAKKLGYIKGANAEERKQRSQWQLEQVKLEKSTQEKLFDIESKEIKKRYEINKGKLDNNLRTVTDNPYSSNLDKSEAQQTYYEQLLQLTTDFNSSMVELEKKYNQNIIESVNERISKLLDLERQLNINSYKLTEERFNKQKDLVNNSVDETINEKNINAELAKQNVLLNDNLTIRQKENEIARINVVNELDQTEAELYGIQSLIKLYKIKSELNQLTVDQQKELNDLLVKEAELITKVTQKRSDQNKIGFGKGKINAPSDSNTQNLIKEKILKSLNLDPDAYDSMIGTVISQSWDLANSAMSNYFDAERNRIEQSKQLAYERIDLEKEQRLAQAQSQAEKDSLEKQAQVKKELADKEASAKLKKAKKAEAKVALATELANIAVAAASNPYNGVSFGAAGVAMYAIMSALALARYTMNVKNIDSAQFARGGKLKGPSHSNGGIPAINPITGEKVAEFEGNEGIINKKSMTDSNVYSVTGTPSQIASKINAIGGGVDWHGGASLKKFMNGGTYLGSNVQPPIFRSYYDISRSSNNNSQEINERLDRTEQLLEQTNETLNREVNRKTIVSSREITDVQRENHKQSEIATL